MSPQPACKKPFDLMNRSDASPNPAASDANRPGVIAVVDDDPCIADAIQVWLNVLGVSVSVHASAESLTQRLSQADQHPVLLGDNYTSPPKALQGVILDVNLGGMSGFDLAHSLRRQYPALPIALITGRSRSELALLGAMPVNVPCLQKPFDLGVLQAALFH